MKKNAANNDHPSVLPFEMYAIEPGEPPSRSLSWKPLGFLSHIMRRTNSDRFPLSLWEVWFCSTIGVPLPVLIGHSQQCACNNFQHDFFGDHLQTCKVKSAASQVHDWVVYRLGGIFGWWVKIHKITPATGKERGDLEIKDYVVLQKSLKQADRLPPPRTLIWTSLWRILDMAVHMCILPVSWQTPGVRMAHQSLIVLYGRWLGQRFYIIANCILIVQTP